MIFFIFSLSSDFNFLTTFSGIDFFIFAHSDIQDTFYEKKFNWISIWYILNKIKCKQSIIQFQWKCLHNIVYSEYRLQKMGNFKNHSDKK
jgi:hypothetical protein